MFGFQKTKKNDSSFRNSHLKNYFCSFKLGTAVFLLFLFVAGYCGYIWYSYVYNPIWSAEKKEQYLKTKDVGINFNRDKFRRILKEEQERVDRYEKNIEEVKDIFKMQ